MTIELKYAEITRDASTFPVPTIHALLSRGFSHVLGNEVSSKVVAQIRRLVKGDSKVNPTTEQIKAFRAEFAARVAQWEQEAEQAALKAMDEGTLGVRAIGSERAQRFSPLDRECRKIALAEVSAILTSNKLAMPKGEGKVAFPNGEAFTREELVARRLAKHGERITKEAEKVLANVKKATGEVTDL
jgi:hypothetical protein